MPKGSQRISVQPIFPHIYDTTYSYFKLDIVSLSQRSVNMKHDDVSEKQFKFYQKIAKAGVIKILITIQLTLKTMQTAYYQTLEEVPTTLVQEKDQKKFNNIQKT